MDVAPIQTNVALAAISRLTGINTALQTEMMKQQADSQEQMAQMLAELGLGQNLDVSA